MKKDLKLVTFNPLRTIGMPGVQYIKPEHMFKESETIKQADGILFPQKWQVPALVYGWKKPIFPSIETLQLGIDKIEMTRGLRTIIPNHLPYTEIKANTRDNQQEILETFPFPFVAKEPKNARGNGVYLIENETQFAQYTTKTDALYVQDYIPHDKELRIVVVGKSVITAYWKIKNEADFHHNVAQGGQLDFGNVPLAALQLVKRVADALNIDHAGFDVLMLNGQPYILEFNVLFGNEGIREQGIKVEKKIYEYIQRLFQPKSPTPPIFPSPKKVS